jgi:2-keto-4-pentenoate hydratase/2-oxohepta-3-ene-1,7-dioic acid hydratase in catechol pathway
VTYPKHIGNRLVQIGLFVKLATFNSGSGDRIGVVDAEQGTVRDATPQVAAAGIAADMVAVIERWETTRAVLEAEPGSAPGIALDSVRLRPPLQPVRDIFCVGKNYRDHVREFGRSGYDSPSRSEDIPDKPIIFSKATTSVTGPYDDVDPHRGVTSELDYEGELGVIIGRRGRGVTRDDAYSYVWGYTAVNDVTARDLQRAHKQWLLGKSLDTHCPLGPYAVSAEEAGDVRTLEVETLVNGERRQLAPVKDLIFGIPELIETISAGITLLPGDIIATGTPAGVGIGFDPPRFLAPGDVVEISITRIGTLRNRIR